MSRKDKYADQFTDANVMEVKALHPLWSPLSLGVYLAVGGEP